MGSIKIKTELKSRTQQATILTVALREALSILEMPVLELATWLQEQIEQNPALQFEEEEHEEWEEEAANPFDPLSSGEISWIEQIPAHPQTLFEHLLQQAREVLTSPDDLKEMEDLIGSLDEKGFLGDEPADPTLLKLLYTFDPPGIGAQNLQHSLLLQLARKGLQDSLAYRLIQDHYEDFIHSRNNLPGSPQEFQEAITALSLLSLDPAAAFRTSALLPQTPDIFIESSAGNWTITLNETPLPRFKLNLSPELRRFESSAKWIEKMVTRRSEIVKALVKIVLDVQNDFFQGKTSDLHPLSFKHIAEKLSLHESTISRAVKDKVVSCPRGIYPLRFFFPHASSDAISHHTAKERIKTLIAKENKDNPFTDDALSKALKEQGILCARRTVTKYRKALQIPPAAQRKIGKQLL